MLTHIPSRSRIRLTRRGRLVLAAAGAVMAGTAVAVPLLTTADHHEVPRAATLVVPEGWRASQVYDAIDKALALPSGSTRTSLGKARLTLPKDAGGNPEGYLFPASYPLRKGATPESVLRSMVDTAHQKFDGAPVAAGAQRNSMNVYQALTIASIIQAQAVQKEDMGKVARVILNRLERGMPLQLDSTLSYALGRARTTEDDTRSDSPYNTYQRMGLPPTPIGNPGEDAMRAALNPTPGDWLYFVTVKPGDTRFTADYDTHLRNVAEYNSLQQQAGQQPGQSRGPSPVRSSASSAPRSGKTG
ncbi:endolytic transglycosylase MltG [Streptomyces sp. AM6-12]|uniref:endolytic transglycosylase MltG n=1 Tax=Streptomyces sp. AM6-12 TaxID=3345149 RepID=UPI00379A9E1B